MSLSGGVTTNCVIASVTSPYSHRCRWVELASCGDCRTAGHVGHTSGTRRAHVGHTSGTWGTPYLHAVRLQGAHWHRRHGGGSHPVLHVTLWLWTPRPDCIPTSDGRRQWRPHLITTAAATTAHVDARASPWLAALANSLNESAACIMCALLPPINFTHKAISAPKETSDCTVQKPRRPVEHRRITWIEADRSQ